MSRVSTTTSRSIENQTHDYTYYRAVLAQHQLPAAFIDLDHFAMNLERLRQRAGNLPIRLVTKSVRSVEMIRRILAAGPFMQGLLCYSVGEAAWLASLGFDDIVVAYPSVEPVDIRAAAAQLRCGHSITLMVDSIEQVIKISRIAQAEDIVIPLAIDLDMSSAFPLLYFGVHRSPVHDVTTALTLARKIAEQPGVALQGLMGYEGQIAGLMDDVPGERLKSAVIRHLKNKSIMQVNARRQAVVEALRQDGHVLRFVNGGGTGSFESTRQDPSVTELAAGSGLYAPTLFDHYRAFKVIPAAGFALPVTRIPKAGVVTCSGGGYIASGPMGKNRLPLPWLPTGCRLIANEAAGEVQTPVLHSPSISPATGDPILFRHAKAGELCERFNELLLIQDGRVIDTVRTYRGEGKSFF
ncbi:amino acid deaminase/aldolase [Pseudomonas fuscovaginae UPB0736]|uniref:amino acid deaminase/aldolase n=1 Tax=Pseudomonas asplenii TaxID=53407 RepID=UPI0002891558|nr:MULTISPECIES: amino acid deaminase/aldolase [Pseudomonas]UUQ64343.1 amino acid deaminase/aldolase [Pseudomonas fuscovaginae UPB0736]UZE27165.1 amino acid deaminase/aldolase [Pseudomonas asplenii]